MLKRRPKFDYENARTYEPVDLEVPPFFSLSSVLGPTLSLCLKERRTPFRPASREEGTRAALRVHPSQVTGCPRAVCFSIVNAPADSGYADPVTQRWFDVGHFAHERLQGYLFEAWKQGRLYRVWENVRIEIEDLTVSGELDAIVALSEELRYVVEIKTANRRNFDGLAAPKTAWLAQVYLYMKATGLRAAIILVECKDSQRLKEFFVPWEDEVWEGIESLVWDRIVEIVDGRLPDGDTQWCYFCQFTKACKSPEIVDWSRGRKALLGERT